MRPVILLDVDQGRITRDSLGLLSHAAEHWSAVDALAVGQIPCAAIDEAHDHGAELVYVSDASEFDHLPVDARVSALEQLMSSGGHDLVLLSQGSWNVDIAARLAARMNAGVLWNLFAIEERDGRIWGCRSTLGDSLAVEVECTTPQCIAIARQGAFEPKPGRPRTRRTERLSGFVSPHRGARCSAFTPTSGTTALAQARIVVAGGRGLGKPANLDMVRDLAAALGGAVGVSLPLVDLGWAPRSMQVGQTGTVVAPQLYIACGISGQFQHRLGMDRSGTIVAINTDKEAPIMSFADLAVVGSAPDVLPQLIERLKLRKAT